MNDLYAILGVSPSASAGEIRRAWRDVIFANHPDRNPGDPGATARAAAANAAWTVLGDDAQRAAYDRARSMGPRATTWAEPPPPPPRWWDPPPTAGDVVRYGEYPTPYRRRPVDPGYWNEQAWLEEQYGRWFYWTRQGTPRGSANVSDAWTGYRRRARRP